MTQCRPRNHRAAGSPAPPARAAPRTDGAPGPRPAAPPPRPRARPADTFRDIAELIRLARAHRPHGSFDALAEHRLRERRRLLAQHAHRRP
ncbi:hypothetical protein ACFC13_35675, partial [Streptomyces sp. NPDC056081]